MTEHIFCKLQVLKDSFVGANCRTVFVSAASAFKIDLTGAVLHSVHTCLHYGLVLRKVMIANVSPCTAHCWVLPVRAGTTTCLQMGVAPRQSQQN